MSEDTRDLHPETLAQFAALDEVRDLSALRRNGAEPPRVDSSTLLAGSELAPRGPSPEPAATPVLPEGPAATLPPRAAETRWYDRPAVLFFAGMAAVLVLGLLGYALWSLLAAG